MCVSGCLSLAASTGGGREARFFAPGCGYPGTAATRSSWHQFRHLISLSFFCFFFFAFFHDGPLCFYLFCMLDTIPRRGLTARVSLRSSMPFTRPVSALSQSPLGVPPRICIWQLTSLPRFGRRSPSIIVCRGDNREFPVCHPETRRQVVSALEPNKTGFYIQVLIQILDKWMSSIQRK